VTILLESAIRVSIPVLLALVIAAAMRRRSAAIRHWVLAAGVVSAAVIPVLIPVAPRWAMPQNGPRALVAPLDSVVFRVNAAGTIVRPATATMDHAASALRVAGWIWLAGIAVGAIVLLVGVARVTVIASRSEPVVDARWLSALRDIGDQLGVRSRVELLHNIREPVLLTTGAWRPRIVLPPDIEHWSEARMRIVLSHELSHVRRGDWLLQLLAGGLRAIYWFNPLVWLACRQLRDESERACDDDVLHLGVAGEEYASTLVEIARTLRRPAWNPAPAMARPSSLQRRVSAMLNTRLDRSPMTFRARVAIATSATLLAVTVAGSGAGAQAGASLSGAFVDALSNVIPNVAMTLRNSASGETYAIRSDADGHFTFDSLPDGDYTGEITAPGFTVTHPFFRISNGQAAQPKIIPLALASVEETVVTTSAPRVTAATATPQRAPVFRPRNPADAISPPRKTRDVRPIYPANRTGDETTIFLEGLIDTNGQMKGLQVLEPADSDFARAAMDAVNQWQFEPTRLHGVPVDTAIRITVGFTR
jgi:TonB family protein